MLKTLRRRSKTSDWSDEAFSPLLQRVLRSRGVSNTEELDLSLGVLCPPKGMPDIGPAAERIANAIVTNETLVLVGDFDADGATSVALAMHVLQQMGAKNVSFVVPNRFDFGYGLSQEIVEVAAERSPGLIVTVDNGVSSVGGVKRASELGIDVVVTDHHLPGTERPAAFALVNPVLPESEFGSRCLAGVGVIYYVLAAVRALLAAKGWFERKSITPPRMSDYLDLVALGTVADVVPLDHNNRILVHQGIRRIRAGRARPGILALLEVSKRSASKLVASDLGFALGPRLNAAGRLDDMTIGIQCLLANEQVEAKRLAVALDELNQARRSIEQSMLADAERMMLSVNLAGGKEENAAGALTGGERRSGAEQRTEDETVPQADATAVSPEVPYGIVAFDGAWHQGVVGIIASRLKDRWHRPVIAFADAGEAAPDELKGSARSIPGLHIRDLLDEIATRYPGLIVKFGGHAMAAGLSLKRVHLQRFERVFDRYVAERASQEVLEAVLLTDGPLYADEMTLASVDALEAVCPWGQAFPEPLFEGDF